MTRHIALLRGINVGRARRVAMADLRDLLADLGYTDVKTHLMSGNALVTSPKSTRTVAREIEQAVERLGSGVKVVVRNRTELAKVVAANPFEHVATDGSKLHVGFLSARPEAARVRELDPAGYAPDQFEVIGQQVYQWCPNGFQDTQLSTGFWEKRLGVTATMRNWNTRTPPCRSWLTLRRRRRL